MTTYKFNSTSTADYNSFNNDFAKLNIDLDYKENDNDDFITNILKKINNTFSWSKKNKDEYTYTILNVTPEMLNLEWNKTASLLNNYDYYTDHPSYDFKINGVPVKVHGNYIQVGSRIIPKFTTTKYFNSVPKKDRIMIYSISMSINSLIAA